MKINLTILAVSFCAVLSSTVSATDDSNHSLLISQLDTENVSWSTAVAQDFTPFIDDNFNIRTADGQTFDMKLKQVVLGVEDPERPAFLPRQQSVIVIFKVSNSDQARLAKQDPQSVGLFHHILGQGQSHISPVIDDAGNYTVELILN